MKKKNIRKLKRENAYLKGKINSYEMIHKTLEIISKNIVNDVLESNE